MDNEKDYQWILAEHAMTKFENNAECLHLGCTECNGTGVKKNGQACVHMISCSCKRCSPYS